MTDYIQGQVQKSNEMSENKKQEFNPGKASFSKCYKAVDQEKLKAKALDKDDTTPTAPSPVPKPDKTDPPPKPLFQLKTSFKS